MADRAKCSKVLAYFTKSNYKWSLCLSALQLSRQPFSQSTSRLAGVSLRTRGSAESSLKLFGWTVLEKAAGSNTRGPTSVKFWTGTVWTALHEFNENAAKCNKKGVVCKEGNTSSLIKHLQKQHTAAPASSVSLPPPTVSTSSSQHSSNNKSVLLSEDTASISTSNHF